MGMSDRRKRQMAERRQRILESAQRLFREVGYDNVTMQDIADASEVSKGGLYLQFRNKEDLILALVQSSFDRLEELIAAAAARPGSACERLEQIARAYIQHVLEEPGKGDHFWLLARLTPDPASENQAQVRERISRLNEVVARVFEEGTKDGTVRADLNAKNLIFLFTLIMTVFVERISKLRTFVPPPIPTTEEGLIKEFIDIFIYYVRT